MNKQTIYIAPKSTNESLPPRNPQIRQVLPSVGRLPVSYPTGCAIGYRATGNIFTLGLCELF